jgi:hypothetical protein
VLFLPCWAVLYLLSALAARHQLNTAMFDRMFDRSQGMLGITLVNVIPAIKPHKGGPEPPAGIGATKGVFWAFMYLTVGRHRDASLCIIMHYQQTCLSIGCG